MRSGYVSSFCTAASSSTRRIRGAGPVTFEIVGCGDGESGALIELRVYRAAFVPALLAAVLTMFSLEDRPRSLPQGLAADVLFDAWLDAESLGTWLKPSGTQATRAETDPRVGGAFRIVMDLDDHPVDPQIDASPEK